MTRGKLVIAYPTHILWGTELVKRCGKVLDHLVSYILCPCLVHCNLWNGEKPLTFFKSFDGISQYT